MNKLFPPEQAYRKCADCDTIVSARATRCSECQRARRLAVDRRRAMELRLGMRSLHPECSNKAKWLAPFSLCAGCGRMNFQAKGALRTAEYCSKACRDRVDFGSHHVGGAEGEPYVRVQDAVLVAEVRFGDAVTPIVASVLRGYRRGW